MSISAELSTRRTYFRLQFNPPIQAEMTIVRVKGKTIETGIVSILIEDLSAGGLRFLSNLKIPATEHIILEFKLTLLGQYVKLLGYVVRNIPVSDEIEAYGVAFTIDEEVHNLITRLLNVAALRQRKKMPLYQTALCETSIEEFFSELKEQAPS
ncbi:PilZ domain-containing protein [Brevibacillus sp. SYSU BS000544]|uniref:PilZ domain-containing protein n=1 Tax=Brevibacillus sp. SYSU BS000544 TaxID=3416443 RepID=UPI003CE5180F